MISGQVNCKLQVPLVLGTGNKRKVVPTKKRFPGQIVLRLGETKINNRSSKT